MLKPRKLTRRMIRPRQDSFDTRPTSTSRCAKPPRRKPISISIPTLTIIVSHSCPPSLAPPAASTPSHENVPRNFKRFAASSSHNLSCLPHTLAILAARHTTIFSIEGGLYSVTALRETWARRRCVLNTRIYHKQASTTSKAYFTRRSSSSSGSHSAFSASVASSMR
jgi:hypothetical protein